MRTYLLAFLVLLVSFAPVSMAQDEKPLAAATANVEPD